MSHGEFPLNEIIHSLPLLPPPTPREKLTSFPFCGAKNQFMSHIETFRKSRYVMSAEPGSSDDDSDGNNRGAEDLQFTSGPESARGRVEEPPKGAGAVRDEEYGTREVDDDELLLCVGTASNLDGGLGEMGTSDMGQSSVHACTATPQPSPFDAIGASYVPLPRPAPVWVMSGVTNNERPLREPSNCDLEEEEDITISTADDVKNGNIDVNEILGDDAVEGGLLDDDDDDDEDDDDLARMRLADELQASSEGMSHEEVVALLEEFAEQKKLERAAKRALREKLQQQKRLQEQLRVKKPTVHEQDESTRDGVPKGANGPQGSSITRPHQVDNDPRHAEYLEPELADFLADIHRGVSKPAVVPSARTTSHDTPPPPPTEVSSTSKSRGGAHISAPQPSAPPSTDYYAHDVAERRMQDQLSELLSEFSNNNQQHATGGEGRSENSSSASIRRDSKTSLTVGNEFLRQQRDQRISREKLSGAKSGTIQRGSTGGVFGENGSSSAFAVSPVKNGVEARHFSVARVAPEHRTPNHKGRVSSSVDADSMPPGFIEIDLPDVVDSEAQLNRITDVRARHVNGSAKNTTSQAPSTGGGGGARAGSLSSKTSRVSAGNSRAPSSSSSMAMERKASVASAVASSVPLSQQVQSQIESELILKEQQKRRLEAERDRRLEKKRNAEREQKGLPPLVSPALGGGAGSQQRLQPSGVNPVVSGLDHYPRSASTGDTVVTVSKLPYHLRQEPQSQPYKLPTPPTTPPPLHQDTQISRAQKVAAVGTRTSIPPKVGGGMPISHHKQPVVAANKLGHPSAKVVGGFAFITPPSQR